MAMSTTLMRVPLMTGEPLQIFGLISMYGCFIFASCNVQHPVFVIMCVFEVLNLYYDGFVEREVCFIYPCMSVFSVGFRWLGLDRDSQECG
jgi:hypothetical protein